MVGGGAKKHPESGPAIVEKLAKRLQSARLPVSQVQRLVDEGRPLLGSRGLMGRRCLMLLARPQDELLLLTSQGRGLKMAPSDVPLLAEGDEWPVVEGQELGTDEQVTAAVAVAQPPRFWTVVTRRGYVRQFLRIVFDRGSAQGDPLVESPLHNDAPVAVVNGDRGDLLVLTRWGKAVRFPQRAIAAPGSVALELDPDDEVVAALPLPSDTQILIVTAAGFAARRDTGRFAARERITCMFTCRALVA